MRDCVLAPRSTLIWPADTDNSVESVLKFIQNMSAGFRFCFTHSHRRFVSQAQQAKISNVHAFSVCGIAFDSGTDGVFERIREILLKS